ncbi:Protein CBG25308 [Caenorhabditis briggsae]|uniref:Protein CBG25308 n=1 Tax=Caenorhabditis briggsae TaxID=6238 RepID=B6IIH8_CAEBR|nr:Protein CBG25308 [Caenorhabditis briggsae]CAR99708.1 Protein CBG25308 [Caenorhabditis briggsae]
MTGHGGLKLKNRISSKKPTSNRSPPSDVLKNIETQLLTEIRAVQLVQFVQCSSFTRLLPKLSFFKKNIPVISVFGNLLRMRRPQNCQLRARTSRPHCFHLPIHFFFFFFRPFSPLF